MHPKWSKGIHLNLDNKKIVFDPNSTKTVGDVTAISHAHSDHVSGVTNRSLKITTSSTKKIFETRSRRTLRNVKTLKYGVKQEIGDNITISLHDSGHVLGSSQFKITCDGKTLVYTGDINCVDTFTLKAAEQLESDILIIESTYGAPGWIFPPRSQTVAEILHWIVEQIKTGNLPVFKVYSLGKAQEIIGILNNFTHVPIVVDDVTFKVNEVHNENGFNLTYLQLDSEEGREILHSGECVCVVSSVRKIPSYDKRIRVASATGWALHFSKGVSFCLSSHADFNQLLNYVLESGAKKVYTVYGHDKQFANVLKKKYKIAAAPLRFISQRDLKEFPQVS